MKKIFWISFLILQMTNNLLLAATSDILYPKQWALENNGQVILKFISNVQRSQTKGIPGIDINWVDTKDIPSEKKSLTVAVLDSGLDLNHPDLSGRIWFNESLCATATNKNNLPCNGYNYLDNNTELTDDVGHGTHVAGIIAANRNNQGIAGAADPRIKIMPVKVLNSQVKGFVYNGKVMTDVIADGMIFAIKNGAEVINLSLGWPKLINLPKVKQAFDLAEEKNVVVIAAAGNNNKDLPVFPCSYENVICVGAMDNRGELTDFTNYGSKVDIVAPGESIVSTYPTKIESFTLRMKGYESKNGSSQAAPYVTAAVATLKLLHPGLTNDSVKKLLFSSSKKLGKNADGRFTKFGMLDMKELLRLAYSKEFFETPHLNPQLKSLTEIKFNSADGKFSFDLGLKNLSDASYKGNVCFSSMSKAIKLDEDCLRVENILAHGKLSLPIKGVILDQGSDSHILLNIEIDKKVYQTSLVFSRDLNNDSEIISHSLGQVGFEDMGTISGDRRVSRMIRVFDKHKRLSYPEYFYLERTKQSETETKLSLLTNVKGQFVIKNITLPKVKQVLSIHRQDINLDGKLDYFIYTLSNSKTSLEFYLLNEDLQPLFKDQSTWTMALTTFEGLPIESGVEKFEWLKINHPTLGNILTPSIYRSYSMPEADNAKVISDRVVGVSSHQFYLNPKLVDKKMTVELRVVDSAAMMKALRSELGILGSYDTKSLYLLRPFPQTEEQSRGGEIKSLLVVNEDGLTKLYEANISLVAKGFSHLSSLETESPVEKSLIYPVVDSGNGQINNEAVFTSLLDRASAEFLVKNDSVIGSIINLQQTWENPVIELVGAFNKNSQKTYLVESRSSLTLLRDNGKKSSLPIYRDSSFPGQSFSETLMPILSEGQPGVYINSTLIYGERLYAMVDTQNKGFIRPLKLSIEIPQGCVPLAPETLADKTQYNFAFLCTDSKKDVSLKFLPMSHL